MALAAGQRLTAELLNAEHPQVEYGSQAVNVAAGGFASFAVVFGTAFPAAPHINITPSNGRLNFSADAITTTGFNLGVNNWTAGGTGTVSVIWQAIEKL